MRLQLSFLPDETASASTAASMTICNAAHLLLTLSISELHVSYWILILSLAVSNASAQEARPGQPEPMETMSEPSAPPAAAVQVLVTKL